MSPGLALLVGVLIGAAVVYFLMQARLQERLAVSEESRDRTDRLESDLEQRLAEQLAELEAEYEQRITAKIEQYQDEHAQQLADLESEYEARLAVLGGGTVDEPGDASGQPVADWAGKGPSDPNDAPPGDAVVRPTTDFAEDSVPAGVMSAPPPVGAAATAMGVAAGATILPDPWDELPAAPLEPTPPPELGISAVSSVPPVNEANAGPTLTPSLTDAAANLAAPLPALRQAAAQALGTAVATNPRELTLALPMLGKLSKDPEVGVRLAAVQALQQIGSAKAVRLLKQSLRDPDSDVVAAASAALNRFKGHRRKTTKAKKKRPKNR
ncbi:MAG: HEAT repeat domain-containing protein [Cyanobacteria bacterium J06627_15]